MNQKCISNLLDQRIKLPQNDSSGSEKQRPDLACNTFRIDRNEHGENFYETKRN